MSEILELFLGLGTAALLGAGAYLIYQLARSSKTIEDKDEAYSKIEEYAVKQYGRKKGIDLRKEALEDKALTRLLRTDKSFQSKLGEKVKEDFFGKETKK